jgi:hypothetical protein
MSDLAKYHLGRAQIVVGEPVTDPDEIARMETLSRQHRQTAAYQIGPSIAEAPPSLLAQYIVEMESDEQQEFLDELIQRLPEDILRRLGEAVQQHLGRGAA